MFFNESTDKEIRTEVTISAAKEMCWVRYRPFENELEKLVNTEEAFCRPVMKGKTSDAVFLSLQPGEAVFLVQALEKVNKISFFSGLRKEWEQPILTAWAVSKAEVGCEFEPCLVLEEGEPFPNLNGREYYPGFSGIFRYEGSFRLDMDPVGLDLVLDFPAISECAEILINGRQAGDLMENGRFLDVTGLVCQGVNTIRVEVSNTLVWKLRDKKSAYMQIKPTGIQETPVLKIRESVE